MGEVENADAFERFHGVLLLTSEPCFAG